MNYETEIIKMFLKNGTNPNFIIDGESPLHNAVYSKNLKLVELIYGHIDKKKYSGREKHRTPKRTCRYVSQRSN